MMEKYRLDLHGVRHADVFRNVDQFIGEHIMCGSKSVNIITGNSDEMKRLVGKCLGDYQLNYQESWFNTGVVVVDLS